METPHPITRKQHAIADYGYIAAAALAPRAMGFDDDKKAALLSQGLSCAVLGQSLATRSEWGLFKLMPFKRHLAMDYGIAAFTMSAPWLFGFSKDTTARNSFLVIGAMGLMATVLTRSDEMKR